MKYITKEIERMSLNFFRFCGSICLKHGEKHKNIDNSHTLAEQTQSDLKILNKEVTAKIDIVHISFRFSDAGFYPNTVGKICKIAISNGSRKR